MRTAIIAITRNGAQIGARLREGLTGAELHVLRKHGGSAGRGAILFDGELKEVVARLWTEVDGFVFVMATGIVVRLVAPYLEGKEKDPAVVVMDDAGRFAISLLSGHLGGANELACRCAFATGASEVITTATDVNCLPSFDMLAKGEGWVIEDLSRVKTLNALLLEGEEIAIVDTSGRVRTFFHGKGRLNFHETFIEALQSGARGYVFVTNRHLPPQVTNDRLLVLRPRNLVLGIGCNSGTPAEEIEAVACSQLKRLFLSIKSVRCIGSAEAKREEPGLLAFAKKYALRVNFYGSDQLNQVDVPSQPSIHAMRAIGAAGVAEPAALLAAEGGYLLLKKVKAGNVTLAIAESN